MFVMHMADALLSPAVGGSMWAVTAGTIAWCSRRLKGDLDDSKLPLMGVLGAFVFAVQMINFAIPGTGSSGHLGGGLLLAILLGPAAAFLSIASVLTVQALFFADGGLLALGCNIFNLGFFPCLVAWPLVFRRLAGENPSPGRLYGATVLAALVALQFGAFAVVAETALSGMAELPFGTFLLVMQPIHLAIGLVEGLVTAALIAFIGRARPEILETAVIGRSLRTTSLKPLLAALVVATVLVGTGLSWFASSRPDGLEWSIAQVADGAEPQAPQDGWHGTLARLQEKIAFLPDYGFRGRGGDASTAESESSVDAGASLSGLIGGLATLGISFLVGLLLRHRQRT
jgi:cobalt/nickel transport system permease protein